MVDVLCEWRRHATIRLFEQRFTANKFLNESLTMDVKGTPQQESELSRLKRSVAARIAGRAARLALVSFIFALLAVMFGGVALLLR